MLLNENVFLGNAGTYFYNFLYIVLLNGIRLKSNAIRNVQSNLPSEGGIGFYLLCKDSHHNQSLKFV